MTNSQLLLHKRSIIETANDQLKNISQIVHSCHLKPFNLNPSFNPNWRLNESK
ncbi:transposase [Nitrosomonas sp. Nm34]|uniref:transposase n=1 Tax=Nitrosomonas sp. Nm34 TaxID=1881055 RepID=UPI001587ED5D